MESDAVKVAIERIKARFHPHYGIDGASDSKQLASDCQTLIATLEQAGEPAADADRHRYAGDQSDLRLRFDTALAGMATTNGDSGWIIHTHGHAHDMERAIKVIEELRAEAPLPTLQRLGQEFDAGEVEPDAWRHRIRPRDESGAGIGEWSEWREGKAANYTNRYIEAEDCPLYAHPPQSRVAAEPVGLREDWSDDLRKIRFRLVWEKAAEGDAAREADKKGTPEMALGDGWRANEQETSRLISVLDQVIKSLTAPSQPDPQSRGQAFDGDGEATAIIEEMLRLADLGFEESMREPQENGNFAVYERAKRYLAALSSAKRGEEG